MTDALPTTEREARGIFPLRSADLSSRQTPQRTIHAIITSITACILACSLLIDLVVAFFKGFMAADLMLLTAGLAILAVGWIVYPILTKRSFPYWPGYVAYVVAAVCLMYFIGFTQDPFSVTTGLQVLPILALYLGWFWNQALSLPTHVLTLAGSTVMLVVTPMVGAGRAVSVSNAVLSMLVMTFAYIVGSYLRWQHERKANTDQLTGVLNRRGALARLRVEMVRAQTSGEPLSLAVIDMDCFKQLNDTRGHAFGDRVLQETVASWRDALRGYDIIGRTGGDEFIVVFPRTTSDVAEEVLARLRSASPHSWTWGVTQYRAGEDLEQLFTRADSRLYDWKSLRNTRKREERLADTGAISTVTDIPNRLQRYLTAQNERQTEFSIVSAGFGLVVFLTAVTAFAVAETRTMSVPGVIIVIGVLLIGAATVIVPLIFGHKYPRTMSLILSGTLFVLGVLVMILIDSFGEGFSVFLFASLIAMYLGAFLGTRAARILMVLGLSAVSLMAVVRFYPTGTTDERVVLLTAVLYVFLVCWYLFEVSSFLYWRSSTRVFHDSLTGALNRFGIREFGEAEVQRASRSGDNLCVVVIDFVGFKEINDNQGHSAGDALLRDSVTHIRAALNLYDLIVRTGGDEFALILPYRDLTQTREMLDNLVQSSPHPWVAGTADLRAGDTLDSLLRRADEDLYRVRGTELDRVT